jgi:hypothetical protein
MDRLNYFNPYASKSESHEDRLTRAFLILLKYSPTCLNFFYNYILKSTTHRDELPDASSLLQEDIQFGTQVGSAQFETSRLLSILITNESYQPKIKIEGNERDAVHDGLITIGDDLSLIIETKPNTNDVWEAQLCPSKKDLSEEVEVLPTPVVLTWHEIISWLHQFTHSERHHYAEKQLASDFLDLVQRSFSYLNPYDRLDLCGDNEGLIKKRNQYLLKSIVNEKEMVKYHNGWGYYIELPSSYKSIRKVSLILTKDQKIELNLYFADTQGQGKALYPIELDIDYFEQNGWEVIPNFHFSFMTSSKIWFESEDKNKFVSYWNENYDSLKQLQGHDHIRSFLANLVENEVVVDKPEEMQQRIYSSKMHKLNVCPGLGLIYSYDLEKAKEMDKKSALAADLREKISFCLKGVLKKEPTFLSELKEKK